jgi:hypothetical protein
MITDGSVQIDAAASTVWDVFTDVERWSEWTASVEHITALDGRELKVGNRFEIKQPRLPKLVWEVTAVDPGAGWTWRQRSPGGTTLAVHEVVPLGPGRTLVRQRIEQRGIVGTMFGVLTARLTRRYLELEGQGLKTRSEDAARADVASA